MKCNKSENHLSLYKLYESIVLQSTSLSNKSEYTWYAYYYT